MILSSLAASFVSAETCYHDFDCPEGQLCRRQVIYEIPECVSPTCTDPPGYHLNREPLESWWDSRCEDNKIMSCNTENEWVESVDCDHLSKVCVESQGRNYPYTYARCEEISTSIPEFSTYGIIATIIIIGIVAFYLIKRKKSK